MPSSFGRMRHRPGRGCMRACTIPPTEGPPPGTGGIGGGWTRWPWPPSRRSWPLSGSTASGGPSPCCRKTSRRGGRWSSRSRPALWPSASAVVRGPCSPSSPCSSSRTCSRSAASGRSWCCWTCCGRRPSSPAHAGAACCSCSWARRPSSSSSPPCSSRRRRPRSRCCSRCSSARSSVRTTGGRSRCRRRTSWPTCTVSGRRTPQRPPPEIGRRPCSASARRWRANSTMWWRGT